MSYIGPSYPSDTWSRIRQWLRSRRRSRSILNMDIERGMSARPPIISSGFSVLFCRCTPVLYFAATSLVCA